MPETVVVTPNWRENGAGEIGKKTTVLDERGLSRGARPCLLASICPKKGWSAYARRRER